MQVVTRKDFIYAAGLFDGEGSIAIKRSYGKVPIHHLLEVEVTNANLEIIKWLKEKFGGTIGHYRNKPTEKIYHRWIVQCRLAYEFLRGVYPYLRIKKEPTQLGLRFQERQIKPGGNQHRSHGKWKFDVLIREWIKTEMSCWARATAVLRSLPPREHILKLLRKF